MNTVRALLFTSIISVSGCVWAAEQLTPEEKLEMNYRVALYVKIKLDHNLPILSYSREFVQMQLNQCLADVEALEDKGVSLPEHLVGQLREFGEQLEIECMKQSAQMMMPQEQLLGACPKPMELDGSDTDDDTIESFNTVGIHE